MTSPTLPLCFDCKYGAGELPCRTAEGAFDFAKVARAIVARGRAIADANIHPDEAERDAEGYDVYPNGWAADCEFDLLHDHPELVLDLMIAEMDACETAEDAAFVAAGLCESAMVKHGPRLIDRVEAIAARSAKCRYILSGIWSQGGRIDPDVWERIRKAVSGGGRMDDDGRTPAAGTDAPILDEASVRALMAERVSQAAADIGN